MSYEFKVVNIAISPAEGRANFGILLDSKTVENTYWKVLLPTDHYVSVLHSRQDRKYWNERAQMFLNLIFKTEKYKLLTDTLGGEAVHFTPPRYK